jgi:hypothetical protein
MVYIRSFSLYKVLGRFKQTKITFFYSAPSGPKKAIGIRVWQLILLRNFYREGEG